MDQVDIDDQQTRTLNIVRDNYIKELQELRRDVATLHNHKEVVAYSALSLSIAGAGWAAAAKSPNLTLLILLFVASCLLHFMLRFQLIHRWHCTQFYQIYRDAITELYGKNESFAAKIVPKAGMPRPSRARSWLRYLIWTRDQSVIPATFNYPTTDFLDAQIKKYHELFVERPIKSGGRKNSAVEIVPTLASLGCIVAVGLLALTAAYQDYFTQYLGVVTPAPIQAALATYLSIISLSLSALAWTIAAFVAPVIKHSYWDGLPANLVSRQTISGWLNAGAAILAAFGVTFQAYASYAALSH